MAYLSYEEYLAYGGDMSQEDFALAEFKARSRIDRMTLARVRYMQTVPEEVKLAMMCIIKVDAKYSADAQAGDAIVASFSTDGYSESYGGVSEQSETIEKELTKQVQSYLFGVLDDNGVPLIYLGVG